MIFFLVYLCECLILLHLIFLSSSHQLDTFTRSLPCTLCRICYLICRRSRLGHGEDHFSFILHKISHHLYYKSFHCLFFCHGDSLPHIEDLNWMYILHGHVSIHLWIFPCKCQQDLQMFHRLKIFHINRILPCRQTYQFLTNSRSVPLSFFSRFGMNLQMYNQFLFLDLLRGICSQGTHQCR